MYPLYIVDLAKSRPVIILTVGHVVEGRKLVVLVALLPLKAQGLRFVRVLQKRSAAVWLGYDDGAENVFARMQIADLAERVFITNLKNRRVYRLCSETRSKTLCSRRIADIPAGCSYPSGKVRRSSSV